ncbi:MAG: hypothetical protein PHE67_00835 [Campylobacterales bacterium]|nr:hypothetical protein [Campylobacterales bacterium]
MSINNFGFYLVNENGKILLFAEKPQFNETTGTYYSLSGAIVLKGPRKNKASELLSGKTMVYVESNLTCVQNSNRIVHVAG